MRITNQIMTSNALANLQKSLTALNKYSTQVETGKIISTASENPVIASKSLRYTTRLYEIDQYKSNVSEANSWLSSTETTLSSTYSILKKMRELIQDCSSETITDSDRNQSLIELKQLRSQIGQEANTNVAGRYIFSGYKTDKRVMFVEDTEVTYNLKETLDYKDADEIDANETGTIKGYSLKLLYGNIADGAISNLKFVTSTGDTIEYPSSTATDVYEIKYVNQAGVEPYNVPEATTDGSGVTTHTIHVVMDTGEIVFNENDYKTLSNNIDVEYTKNRFGDGDLNPLHYLKCSEKVTLANPNIAKLENNRVVLEPTQGIKKDSVRDLSIGGTTLIDPDGNVASGYQVNYCKSTDSSDLKNNEIRICVDSGEIIFGSDFNARNGQIIQVASYYREETDPEIITTTSEINYPDKLAGSLNNGRQLKLTSKGVIDNNSIQKLKVRYQDATDPLAVDGFVTKDIDKTKIKYALSTDGVTPGADEFVVYTDTGYIEAGSNYSSGTEILMDRLFVTKENKVNEEIKFEVNSNSTMTVNTLAVDVFTTSMIKDLDLLINRIENMPRDEVTEFLQHGLTELDNHIEEVLKQNSTVGGKANRLELISSRLEDDKINFRELKSDNEDVDEAEAATNLAIQEIVYNAALQATSKVLQTSLLDFLE